MTMNKQPDHFFRTNLESFEVKPAADAWERITDSLDSTRPAGFSWWKVAAVLVPFLAATLWHLSLRQDQPATLAEQDAREHIAEQPIQQQPEKESMALLPSASENDEPVITRKTIAANITTVESHTDNDDSEPVVDVVVPTQPEMTIPDSPITLNAPDKKSELSSDNRLVYSVADASRFLKKNSNQNATAADEKSSKLQNLIEVVDNVRTNTDAIGELRQFKEELIAFNFIPGKKQRLQ